MTGQTLSTFFAGMVPYALKRDNIAGAAIAVVRNGKLIFAKGYGYSNVKTRAPVIADQTILRIGSVSKLFTWTAVMQLVQAGKIDLDRNVNAYLDFKIPPKYGKPITMRDLMTHTPGFADVGRDLMMPSPKELFPLRRYLIENMPERIFPPGKIVAYSNYGAALAGYIVQRVSGEPFDQYIEDHIFKPLGMTQSSFMQPLPKALQPDMSQGYVTASQGPKLPFEAIEAAPAGSMSATVTDVAKFMIAQLNQGQYQGASILSPSTVALMHSPQYRAAPGINGFDLGFYQENRNGRRIIGHGGDTYAFHTYLHLITDADVGFFIAFNSAGKNFSAAFARVEIYRQFLNHFFPYVVPKAKTDSNPQRDARRVAGWYRSSRRGEAGWMSHLSQVHLIAQPDGSIVVPNPIIGPQRLREIGPLDYRLVNGQTEIKFVTGSNGRIRYAAVSNAPIAVIQPVHGLYKMGLVKLFVSLTVIAFLSTTTIWLVGWVVRRRYRQPLTLSRRQMWLRRASRIGVLLQLAVALGWVMYLAWNSQLTNAGAASAHSTYILIALYIIGVFGILGGIAVIAEAVWRVVKGPGKWLCRSGEVLLGLSALYGIWFIFAFGLVEFTTRF